MTEIEYKQPQGPLADAKPLRAARRTISYVGNNRNFERSDSMNTQRAVEPQNPASRHQLCRSSATVGLYSLYASSILTSVTSLYWNLVTLLRHIWMSVSACCCKTLKMTPTAPNFIEIHHIFIFLCVMFMDHVKVHLNLWDWPSYTDNIIQYHFVISVSPTSNQTKLHIYINISERVLKLHR